MDENLEYSNKKKLSRILSGQETHCSTWEPSPQLGTILQVNPHFDPLAFPLLHLSVLAPVQHLFQSTLLLAFLSQPSSHLSSPLINLHSAAFRIPSCFSPLLLLLLLTSTSACRWSHEEAISGEFSVECETLSRFNSLSASSVKALLCNFVLLIIFATFPCPIVSL